MARVWTTVGRYNLLRPNAKYLAAHFEWPEETPQEVKRLRTLVLWEVRHPEDQMEFETPVEAIDAYLSRIITTKDRVEFLERE